MIIEKLMHVGANVKKVMDICSKINAPIDFECIGEDLEQLIIDEDTIEIRPEMHLGATIALCHTFDALRKLYTDHYTLNDAWELLEENQFILFNIVKEKKGTIILKN